MPTDTTMLDLCSIIEQASGIRLQYVASSHGGEFCGPCVWCGGRDRMRVWPNAPLPHYWCRDCNKWGDAVQFLTDMQGLSYHEACERLGIEPGQQYSARKQPLALTGDEPPAKWQESAHLLAELAEQYLWQHAPQTLDYLHSRGLTDETIRHAHFGYIPQWKTFPFEDWGLTQDMLTEAQWAKGGVKIPDGLLIPWYASGKLYKLTVKRPFAGPNELKYGQIVGSCECLYNADDIAPGKPALVAEAVLDALSAWQEARDLAACVATDSTTGARTPLWVATLSMASQQLIAFDVDDNHAGLDKAHYWLDTFPKSAVRHVPWRHDLNDMLRAKLDLREWLQSGLALSAPVATPEPVTAPALVAVQPLIPDWLYPDLVTIDWSDPPPEFCAYPGCTRDMDDYDDDGYPLCHAHYLSWRYPPCGLCGSAEWMQRPEQGDWVCKPCWLTLSTHKPAPVAPIAPAAKPSKTWKDYWSK